MVVTLGIVVADGDLHAEFVLEVEERFLHVADDHGDVIDACLLELADEAFDENLALDFEQRLGLFERERGKPRSHARGEDDGVVDAIGLERGDSGARGRGAAVEQALFLERGDGLVHRSNRDARLGGDVALGRLPCGAVCENLELVVVNHYFSHSCHEKFTCS